MNMPTPNAGPGPLSDHVRKGRAFKSPLAAIGVLEIGDWVRDDLPDLIWPALVLADRGTSDAVHFVRWQEDVLKDLAGHVESRLAADWLDGRLTSLDRLAALIPMAKAIVKARASERGLLSGPVVRALASYPRRPADWLLNADFEPPDQASIDLLARALRESIGDGHREAVIKCLRIWSNVQAGTFSSNAATIDLLRTYPIDPSKRRQADSAIRAMWGAHRGCSYMRTRTTSPKRLNGKGVLGCQFDDYAMRTAARQGDSRSRQQHGTRDFGGRRDARAD